MFQRAVWKESRGVRLTGRRGFSVYTGFGFGGALFLRLRGIAAHDGRRLLDRQERTGARDAAARARHALEQIPVVLARLGEQEHLPAVSEPLRAGGFHLAVGVDVRDRLAHRVRDAAGNGKAAARRRAFAQRSGLGDLGEVDALCLKHAHDLFKRQNKIDLTAHARAHGFELFSAARPDERDLLAGVLLLAEARREHHGRERHGDAVRLLREELFCHICPARAAGCRHERLLSGDLLQKVLCLVERAEIRADGYLRHMAKAEHFHRGLELVRRHIRAELADKRGRNDRNDLFTAAQRLNELEQLALIRDRTERTVHKAHAAGDAFIVIDLGAPMLVGADGVHAARLGARALLQNNRVVGADVRALSAADAEILLNAAHAAVAELDSLFRADLAARMRQTVLT